MAILNSTFSRISKWLLLFSAMALTIKLLLQLISTIPLISTLAYGFRPIVIGYLHLVLLGVITLFLIGFMLSTHLIVTRKISIAGILIFTCGIIINEIFLMTQGISALSYTAIPNINEALLATAIMMFAGLLFFTLSIKFIPKGDFNHK
jgi:hypothetical protein